MIYTLLFILWLLLIAFQDFKYRGISWYLFPVGMGIGLLHLFQSNSNGFYLQDIGINVGFIIGQLFIVTVYFSIKNKRLVNIFDHYFGIGDFLFLLVITLLFSPANYILLIILSLLVSLLGYFVFAIYRKVEQIPLAGSIALVLVMVLGMTCILPLDLYSDQWILNLMM